MHFGKRDHFCRTSGSHALSPNALPPPLLQQLHPSPLCIMRAAPLPHAPPPPPQTGAVFIAANTYSLTALVDEDKLLAWIAFTRNPRHLGVTNCVALQACGNYMLTGSILSLVFLLHGLNIVIMASCILAFLMICNLALQAFLARGYRQLYKKA